MVAAQDHDRSFPQAQPVEDVQDQADLGIHEGNTGIIAADGLTLGLVKFAGQSERFPRIEVEVFAGSDEGRVRLAEAGGEEEGPPPLRFQQPDDGPRSRPSGSSSSGPSVGRLPRARRPARAAARARFPPGPRRWLPRRRCRVRLRDLAGAGGEVAVLPEVLRQELRAFQARTRMGVVAEDARGCRTAAAEQRRAGRVARRRLAVSALEAHATSGEPIEVRRADHGMTITAQAGAEVVHEEEQDVAAGRRLAFSAAWRNPLGALRVCLAEGGQGGYAAFAGPGGGAVPAELRTRSSPCLPSRPTGRQPGRQLAAVTSRAATVWRRQPVDGQTATQSWPRTQLRRGCPRLS